MEMNSKRFEIDYREAAKQGRIIGGAHAKALEAALTLREEQLKELFDLSIGQQALYEGMFADKESRKWIAPSIWEALGYSCVQFRKYLLKYKGLLRP